MTLAWPLYLRIADGLATEFEVVDADERGVTAVDSDGREWLVTAKEVPA